MIGDLERELPGPGGTFRHEVVTGEDELVDTENALLFEGRDGSGAGDSLHRPLEGLVDLLRQYHCLLYSSPPPNRNRGRRGFGKRFLVSSDDDAR